MPPPEQGVTHIVVATNTGDTAEQLMALGTEGLSLVAVTHAYGFKEPGKNEMDPERRAALKQAGVEVLTTSHVLSGGERGISALAGGVYPMEMVAHTLRMLGQGLKVCVEVSIMALDAGLIPYGQPVVAIGGSGRGADTAVTITPSHAKTLYDTRIHEIICKPALYPKQ